MIYMHIDIISNFSIYIYIFFLVLMHNINIQVFYTKKQSWVSLGVLQFPFHASGVTGDRVCRGTVRMVGCVLEWISRF